MVGKIYGNGSHDPVENVISVSYIDLRGTCKMHQLT